MRNKPKVVGLTGGSGVGKGEVCRIFATYGAHIVDTDSVAHGVYLAGKPAYDEVLAAFGTEILDEGGEILRKKLGAVVFGDKALLAVLSSIVHKYVILECNEIISATDSSFVVIDAPALVEADMHTSCDIVIGVFADIERRISRIAARDGISREAAAARCASQMPDDVLRTYVDIAIENNGDLADLEGVVNDAWTRITQGGDGRLA